MNKKAKVLFTAITIFGSFFIFAHPAYAAYEVGISSSGLVDLGEIMPSPSSGALSNTASDTITITTNCSAGYNVYATGTNGGSTSLVDTTHGNTIATSANAITSPNTLAPNTWGLVANQASATNGNFSGLPAYTTNLSSISPIYTAGSTEASIRDDHIPVYYGIKVDTDTVPGNYTTDVLYTVLMNGDCLRYTLNFDGNGATTNTLESQTVDFGASVNLSNFSSTDKIAKTGYTLSGWKIRINSSTSEITYPTSTDMVLDDSESSEVTLVAQWTANTYTIAYAAGSTGGTCNIASTSATYDQNVTLSSTKCTKAGHTQDGWSTSSSASNTKAYDLGQTLTKPNFTTTNNATYTLYPHFTINKHTVTVNKGTGISSTSGSNTYNYGSLVTISATPASGYKFSSWTVNSGGVTLSPNTTTSSATFTMPDNDVAITANGVVNKVYFQTAGSCSTIPVGTTGTLTDSRDNQEYTVYRFGSSAPSGMSNYCLMTKDLSLGYVTGGSVTKGANLTLTANDSASAGTITARTGKDDWSNSYSNLQYINGAGGTYDNHSYYSWGAAMVSCPKGWRPPTKTEYDNIATFMGGNNSTGSANIRGAPYNFVYGGEITNSGWYNFGSLGVYWSSTEIYSTFGYYLIFNSWDSNLHTDNAFKDYGQSVRCVSN